MNLSKVFPARRLPAIEPLEQRIAPALLVTGANLLGGNGNPNTGETSIGGNTLTIVKVLSGEAIVWYDHGVIAAISVGPNTSLDILGNVGEIIGNLTATGHLSDSDNNPANGLDGNVLLANNITGISTHPLSNQPGNIGAIITGGSVSNLNISGNLTGVYAGDGAFYHSNSNALLNSQVLNNGSVVAFTAVDTNPLLGGIQNGFIFQASNAVFASGASISNVKIGAAEELQMFAGSGASGAVGSPGHPGGIGQAGGSISGVVIGNAFIDTGLSSSTPSYNLMAGAGGNGTKGGAGGSITGISEVSSSGIVDFFAGVGGVGASGPGGAGGSIKGLNMQSDSSAYTVLAGKGGNGSAHGGAGGSVTNVNFGGNALSNGLVIAAPFTASQQQIQNGTAPDDVLLIDTLTGTMVLEKNVGNGSFIPVIQDNVTNLTTISTEGETPVAATVVDVNGDGLPDLVVAYKNSENLGIYTNQGGGIFYQQNFTNGSYTGDTLVAKSISLPFAPSQLASGNFAGDGNLDLAVIVNNAGTSDLLTLTGTGTGTFSVPSTLVPLPSNPVSLIATADVNGDGFTDLFVGFQSGIINALLSTGSTTTAPFSVAPTGVTVGGGILNLDYNAQEGILLALNGSGTAISIYETGTAGSLINVTNINLTVQSGTALVAHFVPETQTVTEPIEVLSSVGTGSRVDVWSQQASQFVLTSSTASTEALKNFTPVMEGATSGVAAVGGSVEHFAFSQDGATFTDVSLPFSGKKVDVQAGDGGDGVATGNASAPGGFGGSITAMNILAGNIELQAGNGGASFNALAGLGGSIIDTPTMTTIAGQTLPTILEADYVLQVSAGNGGVAGGTSHTGVGGAGGQVKSLNLSLLAGDILVGSGEGGNGGGGTGGAGGAITSIKSIDYDGDLTLTAGFGGNAGATGNGGAGGAISQINDTLSPTSLLAEGGFNVSLSSGNGGTSTVGDGGAGGMISFVKLSLEPTNESVSDGNASPATTHADTDSTIRITMTSGTGGSGAEGGDGGEIKDVISNSVFTQIVVITGATAADSTTFAEVNPVTATFVSGNGGAGTHANGGNGGLITDLTLSGISHYDPDGSDPQASDSPLVITTGHGGNGAKAGGDGGGIINIDSQNSSFEIAQSGTTSSGGVPTVAQQIDHTELAGASIVSGHGGDGTASNGGAGGTIANLSVGVEGFAQDGHLTTSGNPIFSGGELNIQSGAGGLGGTNGRGGAAGGIINSTLGSASTFLDYGLLLQGGTGGSGTLGGGGGGSIVNIQLNAQQNPVEATLPINNFDGLATVILAGNGGAATGATATGGLGGSISKIIETKDINTSINLLQAGNGGAAVKTGGLGGSVTSINTVGLIGEASDDAGNTFGAFQTAVDSTFWSTLFPAGVPEGAFAGRGGAATTAGNAGSVVGINAYAISAIGAAADANGLFAAAQKVASITASYIGFSASGSSVYQGASPDAAQPTDGFIFSVTTPTGINAQVLTGAEF